MDRYKKNKITLIGCGRWGKNILRDLLSMGCQVSVVDTDETARQSALEMGAFPVFASTQKISEPQDGYVIATPTMSHVSVIESLCDSHCPIFVEKPLAPSLEDVRKLEQRAGDRIFVMQKWRYHPGIEELSRLASSKEFGLLKSACSRRVQWSHPHKDVDASWILAPHDMAIIQHIFGKIPEVRFGYGEKVGNRMESLIAVLGKDPSAVIEVSSLRPKTVRLVVVRFEGAIASLNDPLADHIEIKRIDMETGAIAESSEIRSISTEFPLLRELKVFLDFLNGGPPPPTDIQSEISIIKSITEARRLAESNSSAG